MEQNKTGQYLKYAIGEIILVVIGILIALQINNWNEERKRSNQEQKTLLALKSDFLESKERLRQTITMQVNVVKRSSALIQVHQGKIPRPINDSIKVYLSYGAFAWYRAELVTGAYDALINTGNSDLIKNRDLNRKLAEYFSILNSGFEDQESSMSLLNDLEVIVAPHLLPLTLPRLNKRIGLDTIPSPNESEAITFLLKQDAFFGLLYRKTSIEELRYNIQKDLLNRIQEILAIIDNELMDYNEG